MSTSELRTQALQKRLVSFAAAVLKIAAEFPSTPHAQHIARQFVRSATSSAANYAEARGAESRPDFVHKLRIVLKELNETDVWLQIIVESSMLSEEKTTNIVAENHELCRILVASLKTAGGFWRTRN